MWRNNPDVDGSWWWYQIPVYNQTYTDYKWVSSSDDSNNTSIDESDGNNASQPSTSGSGSDDSAKVTPKKTSVTECTPKNKSCKITYKKCSGKCNGYQIRYGTNKKFKGCNKKKIKGRKNCSVTITGLKAGTKYYYQVRCYRICGKKTYYSSWTKCRSFTTKKSKGKDPTKVKPNKTSIIKCTPKKKSCRITYKRCSSKCTGYQIRYCTNRKFKGCKTKTIKGRNKLTCNLSGLKAGTRYYYQIRCYRKVGKKTRCSVWSKCKSFKTKKSTYSTPKGVQYQLLKYKDKVYCGVGNKLVTVNLKTKEVKTLATTERHFYGITDMCVKNGYLYYVGYDGEDYSIASLYRISLNGNENKLLHSYKYSGRFLRYKLTSKKIYLLDEIYDAKSRYVGYSMNLDGTSKKVDARFDDVNSWDKFKAFKDYEKHYKVCNVSGYSMEQSSKDLGDYKYKITVWLHTPNKDKIKAGSYMR